MTSSILLSVVIPTLNRTDLLSKTLSRILLHYPVGDPRVEFVVVDNASDVEVKPSIKDYYPSFRGTLRYIRFQERVDIVSSFKRCVQCVKGSYVQIFGDDDFPCGLVGYQLLNSISSDNPGLIYLNRFIGDELLETISEIAHPKDVSRSTFYLPLRDFITRYNHWPGFITSIVFSNSAWEKGVSLNRNEYPGYTFLNFLFRSPEIDSVLVFGEPLIIQRRGSQSWKKYWPLYWYIGMGNLLSDLDTDGISHQSLHTWLNSEVKATNLAIDLLIANSLPYIYDKSFWRRLDVLFSDLLLLRIIARLISLLPPSISLLILNLSPNKSKYGIH